MKKRFLIVLLAVSFASMSFAPEKSKNTQIANMVKKVSVLSGLKDPDKIRPGRILIFPFPTSEDRWMENTRKGDCVWTVTDRVLFGHKYMLAPDDALPILPSVRPVVPIIVTPIDIPFDWDGLLFWILLAALFIILLGWIYTNSQSDKRKRLSDELRKKMEAREKQLLEELKEIKKKVPVDAPALVNADWLKNNSPIDAGHDADYMGNAIPTSETVERVFGKMPDLLVSAIISTKENAVDMEFSYNRRAMTGLSNVPVWLGFNWVPKKGRKKAGWVKAGMVATACSNGFQDPKNILSMDQLFTSVELVDKTRYPILSCDKKVVPEKTPYPELVAGLVKEYYKLIIADLSKAGFPAPAKTVVKKGKK